MSFGSIEAAARARIESKSRPYKGVILFVCQFEPKTIRQAHLEEARDRKRLENHKKLLSTHASSYAAPARTVGSNSSSYG